MQRSIAGETRQAILSSARELLMEHPNRRLRVNEIAVHANINRTSVYEHFTGIDQILSEILLFELREFRSEISKELAPAFSLREIVSVWVHANLNFVQDGRHALARAIGPAAGDSIYREAIREAHIALYKELTVALNRVNQEITETQFEFTSSVLEAAAKRLERGASINSVCDETSDFLYKALS